MSTAAEPSRKKRRVAIRGCVCPACAEPLDATAGRCPACGFTGAETIGLFSDEAPPLLPVLDAVGLWDDVQTARIEAARDKLRRKFPQVHWRVCAVDLEPGTKLPVFGFWLLNVSEKYVHETDEDRTWTVLLVIDVATGRAAVVPGYRAQGCLDDADWRKVLAAMKPAWKDGRFGDAVVRFFETSGAFLEQSWKAQAHRKRR